MASFVCYVDFACHHFSLVIFVLLSFSVRTCTRPHPKLATSIASRPYLAHFPIVPLAFPRPHTTWRVLSRDPGNVSVRSEVPELFHVLCVQSLLAVSRAILRRVSRFFADLFYTTRPFQRSQECLGVPSGSRVLRRSSRFLGRSSLSMSPSH